MENNYITVEDLIKKNESGINKKRSERVLKDLHDSSKKYCIPLDNCQKGKFIINYKAKTCERRTDCSFNFFDGTDPFINDNNPEPTSQITDTP